MPYSAPIGPSYPQYVAVVRHTEISGGYPVTVHLSAVLGDASVADADAIVQKAIDALAGAGFAVLEAAKATEYRQNITVTPA